MPKNDVRRCQNCQGNGTILVEVKPGEWQNKTCTACGGTGKITISTI